MWTTGRDLTFNSTRVSVTRSLYADGGGCLSRLGTPPDLTLVIAVRPGPSMLAFGAANAFDGVNIWTITGGAIRKL